MHFLSKIQIDKIDKKHLFSIFNYRNKYLVHMELSNSYHYVLFDITFWLALLFA